MGDITGIGEAASAIANVTNNVIDKIATSVGIVYSDSIYKIKKDSLRKVYDEIANNKNIDYFSRIAIISNLNQDLKYYENQRNVISKAINDIEDNIDVNKVDDDWLNFFFDKVKIVSSEEMQNIWGKVLSEEFNKPASIPKSLLHTISCIDLKSAKTFNKLCQFVAKDYITGEYIAFVDHKNYSYELSQQGISFQSLLVLDRFGLISFDKTITYCYKGSTNNIMIYTKKNKYILKPDNEGRIPLGNVILTQDGKILCKCIQEGYNSLVFEMINSICKDYIIKIIEIDS